MARTNKNKANAPVASHSTGHMDDSQEQAGVPNPTMPSAQPGAGSVANRPASVVRGGVVGLLLLIGTGLLGWHLTGPSLPESRSAAGPPPARVSRIVREDDFSTIKLTEQARKRLGVKTAAVQEKPMPRVRVLGGEVLIPPGSSLIVSAPLAGTLASPSTGSMPAVGAAVRKNQVVVQLVPLLTPEGKAILVTSRIDAEVQLKSAKRTLTLAQIDRDRARAWMEQKVATLMEQHSLKSIQKRLDLAVDAVNSAEARLKLLTRVVGDLESNSVPSLPVAAPEAGLLRTVSALPGQTVPAGAALFEIADCSRVWVRVGVYVGDLPDLAAGAAVRVGNLIDRPNRPPPRPAEFVKRAPPSANPQAATVELFYKLDNPDGELRPGQRVAVHVPLKEVKKKRVVPWSAVVHDYHGGAWVYVKVGERTYARHRVRVLHVMNGLAVLEAGPPPQQEVVSVGAIELFGAEVGFAK